MPETNELLLKMSNGVVHLNAANVPGAAVPIQLNTTNALQVTNHHYQRKR